MEPFKEKNFSLERDIIDFAHVPESRLLDHETRALALKILKNLNAGQLSQKGELAHLFKKLVKNNVVEKLKTVSKALHESELVGTPISENLELLHRFDLQLRGSLGDDYELILQTSPEMLAGAAAVKAAIATLNDANVEDSIRASFVPQATGSGTTNGSYFLYTKRQEDAQGIHPAFVAKPAIQEAGSSANPQGNVDISRSGIGYKQGIIRERLVYEGQVLLGVDCGIPPTCILELNSPQLHGNSKNDTVAQHLTSLKKVDDTFSHHTFVRLMATCGSTDKIIEHFKQKVEMTPLNQAIWEALNTEKRVSVGKLFRELSKKFKSENEGEFLAAVKSTYDQLEALKGMPESVGFLWNWYLRTPDQDQLQALNPVSIQKFVKNGQSLLSFQAKDAIPLVEFHKLFIDVVFFNTDRHLGNILWADGKLHLIDHGLCLPEISEDAKELAQARMEFMNFPQVLEPLCDPYAKAISDLDIPAFIEALKKAQQPYESRFGTICHIQDACYKLIELNLHLLKVGVSMNAPLRDICLFLNPINLTEGQFGGEVIDFYLKHCGSGKEVDWVQVDAELKKILAMPLEQRKRVGVRIENLFV